MISSLNLPAFVLLPALFCEARAKYVLLFTAVILYFLATFSAVMPMWYGCTHPINHPRSWYRPICVTHTETIARAIQHMRRSAHIFLTASDDNVSVTDFNGLPPDALLSKPLPQTLLIVIAGTITGKPALMTACRAAFCPTPAVNT
jgi:hypothetical protein